MKGLTGRLGVGFMRVLALLPLPVLRGMGWLLGQVAFVLVAPRRRVALRNLALCFPDWTEARRRAVARPVLSRFARPGWTAAGCGPRRVRWWSSVCV